MESTDGENNRPPESPALIGSLPDEVFASGDDEEATFKVNNMLHADYGSTHDQVLPRKSSLMKDSNRRNRRKKTVSFSSMPGEKTIINAPDCLYYMQTGSELIKVRLNGRQYHRLFTLDSSLKEIRWHPSSKKPHKAKLLIDQIREIRVGKNTDVLRCREIDGNYQDACVFSIIFGDTFESLDLIANSPDEANIWVTGLTFLTTPKNRSGRASTDGSNLPDSPQLRDQWLQEVFESADVDGVGELDELEVVRLMKKLNNSLATVKIKQKLKEMSTSKESNKERLTSSEFVSIFKEISTRPEIYFLLVRYASASDFMNTDELLLFLEVEQGMSNVTVEKCLEIIGEFEPSTQGRKLGQLGIDGFTAFLLSEECDIFDPVHLDVCQNMTHPLTHYFLASSHKTYLLKDQLKGPSSTEGYERALKKGCRYVELDCWDGPDEEPIIYHGHTLTSKITFKSAIDCINEFAFEASDYPLILSIESHCGMKQQETLAFYIRQVFADKLYTAVANGQTRHLPSPESLRKKIIIKCKKLPAATSDDECTDGFVTEEDETLDSDQQRKASKKESAAAKKYKLSRNLSNLTLLKSVQFHDFKTLQQGHCSELYSFSESLALRLANTVPEEFVNHNKRFLSRVYPNGMRVDSSNYNPQDLWNCGCQLVALNYQTCGLMMDLYDGRFLQNGGCGYVLKPVIMRDEMAYFSASTRDIIPGVSPQILHVRVISGQQLPKPKASGAKGNIVDPYVTVEIFGIPADCVEERTKTVHHTANPLFDECFEFQINLPELALVRFAVLDDDFIGDEFIGQYTIPFVCMQPGYRHIHLRSNTGETMANVTLFVHIAVTNRKGGGKSSRRGYLLKKKKSHQNNVRIKTLGIKNVDDAFKVSIQPLSDTAALLDAVQSSLTGFKEACGLAPISNIKQTIRALLSRISNTLADTETCIQVSVKDNFPVIDVECQLPDAIKRALTSFELYTEKCRTLTNKTDAILDKLEAVRAASMEFYEDLQSLALQHGIKGKKLNKTVESFAWNIRVLKGQGDLLRQANIQCHEDMKQIKDTAVFMGLVQAQPAAAAASEDSTANCHQSSESDTLSDLTTNQFPAVSLNEP